MRLDCARHRNVADTRSAVESQLFLAFPLDPLKNTDRVTITRLKERLTQWLPPLPDEQLGGC